MKVSSVVQLPDGLVKFEGELGDKEAELVVELGLNYLIRAGAFPAITQALKEAQEEENAAQGYEFPEDMDKND